LTVPDGAGGSLVGSVYAQIYILTRNQTPHDVTSDRRPVETGVRRAAVGEMKAPPARHP